MKRTLALLMLLTLLIGIESTARADVVIADMIPDGVPGLSAQEVPLAGGYREVSQVAPEAMSAARFAIRAESRRERARISLVSIERAERQVVAGLNYRLLLRISVNGTMRNVKAEVYQDLRQRYSLSLWEATDDQKYRSQPAR